MAVYRLEYSTIKRATDGDDAAISEVLKHFDGYIKVVAREKILDDEGNIIKMPKEDVINRLKGKLAIAVRKFKADRIM